MGREYAIRCRLPVGFDARALLSRLENPTNDTGWTAFTVIVEPHGFYFCDNLWSEAATRAFRQLIDEALQHADSVIVEEP